MQSELALPAAPAAGGRLRQAAIPVLFLLLGVVYASWAARLPAIREARALDPATLGTVLLGGGIGAVCSFPLAAWLIGHFGARRAALLSGCGLLLALPPLAWLPTWPVLMAGVLLLGANSSCFDVAINALGAEEERAAGRSIMSMLHAWFCVGTFGGALLASAAAGAGLTPGWHFLLISLAMAALLLAAYRVLPCDAPDPEAGRKHFALPHGALVWLGLIAFLGAVSEGSLTDWIAIYLRDHLHASEAVAPLGYAAFAGAMLAARLVGDRLKEAFGARRLVAASSLLAAVGVGSAVLAPSIGPAAFGFALAGLGVAAVFPCLFSAAGREGPAALAGVATLGYSGSLLGPPIMGYVVHGLGLQAGLVFLAIACLGVAVAASSARLLR
ncbi:MFS transporter [Chitinimonas koreensis]|uniref:MFS transporter n=1 Tax=Chitinimonas koreensis TaxID=356302 RepID=UPI00041A7783|nr:MFS transporter [Chitinimonas koreensis]QNM98337.1 MFS transporter [Chitinimonas koreensis]